MISVRVNLLIALRDMRGEPAMRSVIVSTVANATRRPAGDINPELERLINEGLVQETHNRTTDTMDVSLTQRGEAAAQQIR